LQGEVDALRLAYDSESEDIDINSVRDPNVVAALLKMYLRELPEPLLPAKDYDAYLSAVQKESSQGLDQNHKRAKQKDNEQMMIFGISKRILTCFA
jgi:hypothetical protein